MQQDGETARHRHAFLRVPPATRCKPQAPLAQITVGTKRANDIVSRTDQEPAQEYIAAFADRQLRRALPRVALA